MIRKNTRVIFEDGSDSSAEELVGGMPLSKGEIVHVHSKNKVIDYIVSDKIVDCFLEEKDPIVNITYKLRKK